jgi:hypothetical protein
MDFRLDPVHSERHQPYAAFGIIALDGFHEADISLLNQVGLRQPITFITARNSNHYAQVRQYQLAGCVYIIFISQGSRQAHLFLLRKDRKAVGRLDVAFNATACGG